MFAETIELQRECNVLNMHGASLGIKSKITAGFIHRKNLYFMVYGVGHTWLTKTY